MCGRTALAASADDLRDAFGLRETPEVEPRYNVTPSRELYAVRALVDAHGRAPVDEIHDRMPVVIDRDMWDDWLDPHVAAARAVLARATAPRASELVAYPVSTFVNDPRHRGPALHRPRAACRSTPTAKPLLTGPG